MWVVKKILTKNLVRVICRPPQLQKKIKLKAQVQILIKMDEARWPNLAVPNFYFIFKKIFN